jgi:hypothetical protein
LVVSFILGPFSVAPCQTLISRFATFSSLYVAAIVVGVYLGGQPEVELLAENYQLQEVLEKAGYAMGEGGSGAGGAGRQKVEHRLTTLPFGHRPQPLLGYQRVVVVVEHRLTTLGGTPHEC